MGDINLTVVYMEAATLFYICLLRSTWLMLGNPPATAGCGEGPASRSLHPPIKTSSC